MMETPVEIEYLGSSAPPAVRRAIETHVAALEKRFGRITSCRIAVETASGRHRSGSLHQVKIHLALPNGSTIDIDRVANNDERLADLSFAVNHAFKRARRRLLDRVRRMQGQVKTHAAEPVATVARMDPSGDFGFLEAADGREIYFHRNSVLNDGFASLKVGSRVTFFEEVGEKGPQASTVKIAGKHGLRA
jgi:cold shock CspA family protein